MRYIFRNSVDSKRPTIQSAPNVFYIFKIHSYSRKRVLMSVSSNSAMYFIYTILLCPTVFGEICPHWAEWLRRILCWAPVSYKGQWRKERAAMLARATGRNTESHFCLLVLMTFSSSTPHMNQLWDSRLSDCFLWFKSDLILLFPADRLQRPRSP